MKLILTSSGLGSQKLKKDFLKLLEKPLELNKVMLVFGARTEEEMSYVEQSLMELVNLGIPKENISKVNISEEVKLKEKNFDVLYICGGNTFYILDRLRKTKIAELIKDLVKLGSIYIGVSAGSIIAGKSIEIAGWGSEADTNEINLKDLTGFNFTDIAIFPHYHTKLKKEIEDFREMVDYPVKELKNKQGIIIK